MCKRRVKPCRLLAEMALSAVRKNPQEPAGTRRTRRNPQEPAGTRRNPRKHAVVGKKKANPEGLVFPLLVVGCYQRANELGIAIPGPD